MLTRKKTGLESARVRVRHFSESLLCELRNQRSGVQIAPGAPLISQLFGNLGFGSLVNVARRVSMIKLQLHHRLEESTTTPPYRCGSFQIPRSCINAICFFVTFLWYSACFKGSRFM
jgi:hypothetical protein